MPDVVGVSIIETPHRSLLELSLTVWQDLNPMPSFSRMGAYGSPLWVTMKMVVNCRGERVGFDIGTSQVLLALSEIEKGRELRTASIIGHIPGFDSSSHFSA